MAKSKKKPSPAQALAAKKPVAVAPQVDLGSGQVTVNVYNGARQKIDPKIQLLFTIRDGAQNELYRQYHFGPTVPFVLPVHKNFADNYSVIAWADGYTQAGFQPVKIGPLAPQSLDLMLLPKKGSSISRKQNGPTSE